MVKYRELYPNATVSEYSYKKERKNEKLIRCIKLKNSEDTDNLDKEQKNKTAIECIHKNIKYNHTHLIKNNIIFINRS